MSTETETTGSPSVDYFTGRTTPTLHDDEAEKSYPTLLWLLTPGYHDGKLVRLEGRLSIKAEGNLWVCRVEAPTVKLECVIGLPSLKTLFRDLEKALNAPDAPWKPTYEVKKKARDAVLKPPAPK